MPINWDSIKIVINDSRLAWKPNCFFVFLTVVTLAHSEYRQLYRLNFHQVPLQTERTHLSSNKEGIKMRQQTDSQDYSGSVLRFAGPIERLMVGERGCQLSLETTRRYGDNYRLLARNKTTENGAKSQMAAQSVMFKVIGKQTANTNKYGAHERFFGCFWCKLN